MNWVIIDEGWWQQAFLIDVPWYLMDWDSVSSWVIQKTCDHKIYSRSNFFSEIWHMLIEVRIG